MYIIVKGQTRARNQQPLPRLPQRAGAVTSPIFDFSNIITYNRI